MLAKTYAAFKAANVSDELAQAAASELADYENRLNSIEQRLTRIEGRLNFLQWQIGVAIAAEVVIGLPALWLLLRVAAKLGALG